MEECRLLLNVVPIKKATSSKKLDEVAFFMSFIVQ